ncbi:hypothetical protein CGCF415_v002753 [Colletotrichum fructicola]|uniref:Uncharacterized protein n=1 Tax=Colletotrichum fructicola (strain Nara gc5) TaxID=1213859 RepID=L2FZ36_COLFN|nr:uncharacterized protein CGMCC3_g10396 [Colletotrichum fructicola]KAF4483670.1 hypothetical protein CGGC5_v006892 [Colletotrichum fructicola Nara gc5]KAH9229499.1 hypothetical protein K456DRAFT_1728411 [Colletotrichum gloeosporioides 23]KAI8292290.1 hypothetical protein K4K60_007890 [Colletotrichum sp. SAR11_57]KAJ0274369.1 hypothetical protein COL940_009352 [Colletotrichum noveboracense]KAJ0281479.1 hypothetical protein CBS470a_008298 [Colletotrichum nupharicola]
MADIKEPGVVIADIYTIVKGDTPYVFPGLEFAVPTVDLKAAKAQKEKEDRDAYYAGFKSWNDVPDPMVVAFLHQGEDAINDVETAAVADASLRKATQELQEMHHAQLAASEEQQDVLRNELDKMKLQCAAFMEAINKLQVENQNLRDKLAESTTKHPQ